MAATKEDPMTNTSLTQKQTVTALVNAYQGAVAEIRRGFAIVEAAEKALGLAFAYEEQAYHFQIRDRYNRTSIEFSDPESSIATLKREAWGVIVARLEVRRMMSIKRAAELDRQLEKEELPEITIENVLAFARGIEANIGSMLDEAVTEVFDWLRPHHSRYKTNTEFEIGPKVILAYVVDEFYPPVHDDDRYRVNYRYQKDLTALENVFSALDGRGSIAKGQWGSELADAINQTTVDTGRGETRYFKFRCFRNRNLHLEFKRPDLVDKLNKMAGGMRLHEKREEA
jgi:Domain of unknown function (DUF4942)